MIARSVVTSSLRSENSRPPSRSSARARTSLAAFHGRNGRLPALLSLSMMGLVIVATIFGFPQKVTTKVTVYNEIFLTAEGLIGLPDNAVELEPAFTIRTDLFSSPLGLALDPEGNVYVSSMENGALCRFSVTGEFLGQLGTRGGGKSVLKGPAGIVVAGGRMIVHEKPRRRLEFLDLMGKRLGSQNIPEIESFAVDGIGCLYVAPLVDGKDSPLVRAYGPGGRTRDIGRPLVFHHSMQALNSRSIAVSPEGDVYVAFRYFPIVRKYAPEGALLAEFRIESPVLEAKETYNLKAVGEGIVDISQRVAYKPLIIDIQTSGGKIFLLGHNPRLEIMELDGAGGPAATYWMDAREIYLASGFAVREVRGEKLFYVARVNPPPHAIDVLKIKEQAPAGLEGEVQKWSAELAAYPENSLAYINRGVARHHLGDYRGALEDFSRAIELDPLSAQARNNRGLSRMKAEDIDGAISDFSKAIELDPEAAAVYFNRGIALIHKSEFHKAIGDFASAAKIDQAFEARAREQIEYCRTRLSKIRLSISGGISHE